MKAKNLEIFLGRQSGFLSEMVNRFQTLRDYGLLPKDRGRNADKISSHQIIDGILGVVSDKPGFAGVVAIGLKKMKPVGVVEDAFAQGETLGAALTAVLENKAILDSLIEVRLQDSDPRQKMSTTAEVVYKTAQGEIAKTQYLPPTALTAFTKGSEKTFDRRSMGEYTIVRETVLTARMFQALIRDIESCAKFDKMYEGLETPLQAIGE